MITGKLGASGWDWEKGKGEGFVVVWAGKRQASALAGSWQAYDRWNCFCIFMVLKC